MQEFFLQYHLLEKLATKTLRITYLASPSSEVKRKVIIKIFDRECVNQSQEPNLFWLSRLMSLDHPNIIPVLDIALDQGKPYIVSEYRAHGSLRQRLEQLAHERMDWSEALSIVMQIGRALSYAHAQEFIHGNVKPENVFYNDNGEIQLTDFNLSPFIDVTKLGYKTDLQTTRYMAPEQFMGETKKASDQYALACLAYELFTGHVPFDAQSFSSMWGMHTTNYAMPLSTRVPKIPMPIDMAILKALSKKNEDRHEDMNAFLTSLEHGLASQTSGLPHAFSSSPGSISDLIKTGKVTKPFGFTPFPDSAEYGGHASLAGVSEGGAMQEQGSLLAIDPPSLSGLRRSNKEKISESQAAILSGVTENITSRGKPEQATDLLPGIEQSVLAPSYSQLSQISKRVTDPQTNLITEQSSGILPAAISSALSVQYKRRKLFIFWISAISVALILLGVLTHSLFNSTSPRHVDVSYPISNSIHTTAGVMASPTAGSQATKTTVKPTSNPQVTLPPIVAPQAPSQATPQGPSQVTPIVTPRAIVPVIGPTQHSSPTAVQAVTPTPKPKGAGSIQINAGGDTSGFFVADTDFAGGLTSNSSNTIDTSGVSNAPSQSVYQSNRFGNFSYTIPNLTPNASYTVRLHFAETYWTKVGIRVFNVTLNGQQVLSNFDIIAAAGASNKAVVEQFVTAPNSSGTITIQFVSINDTAQVNGIEVLAN